MQSPDRSPWPNFPECHRSWQAGVATVFLTLIILALEFLLLRNKPGEQFPSQTPFCCPSVSADVFHRANITISPCTNFLEYACHRWKSYNRGTAIRNSLITPLVNPTLQGTITNYTPSRELHSYYRSCEELAGWGEAMVEDAVQTIAGALNISRSMEASAVARLMLHLSLLYMVPSVVDVEMTANRDSGQQISFRLSSSAGMLTEEQSEKFVYLALEAARLYLAVNVTMSELASCFHEKRRPSSDIFGNVGLLNVLVPGVGIATWRRSLQELDLWNETMLVRVVNAANTIAYLRNFTDPSRRPTAIVFMLVQVAFTLAYRTFEVYTGAPSDIRTVSSHCIESVASLILLWEDLFTSALTSPSKDEAVRSMYETVLKSVKNDIISYFGISADRLDTASLRTLLLPSDLIRASAPTPRLTTNYWRNVLLFNAFATRTEWLRYFSGYSNFLYDPFNELRVFSSSKFLFVPPSAYSLLYLDNATEPFVNGAVLGVQLAGFIWQDFYKSLGPYVSGRIDSHTACMRRMNVSPTLELLRMPFLSVLSTIRAFRTSSWNLPAGTWGSGYTFSRSRLFYMLFFYHHVCIPSSESWKRDHDDQRAATKNRLARKIPGLGCAFDCLSLNVSEDCYPTCNATEGCVGVSTCA